MIITGLTGGIGSGKSYVAEIFKTLGIPVYTADMRARELSNNLPGIRTKITKLFGDEAYEGKEMNRQWIGKLVFNNPDLLEKLNDIIHPEVEIDFKKWCIDNNSAPYLMKEAAILFETGSYKKLAFNILVTAPEELRINRVRKRDQMDPDQIKQRILKQWSDLEKQKLADFVIVNDGRSLILPQVLKIHEHLMNK